MPTYPLHIFISDPEYLKIEILSGPAAVAKSRSILLVSVICCCSSSTHCCMSDLKSAPWPFKEYGRRSSDLLAQSSKTTEARFCPANPVSRELDHNVGTNIVNYKVD